MRVWLRAAAMMAAVGLLSGCWYTERKQMRDDITLLTAKSQQCSEDYAALLGKRDAMQKQLDENAEKTDALQRDLESARQRAAAVAQTMTDSQKAQSDALVKDMEERVQRENDLRLKVDDLTAQVEALQNEKALNDSALAEAKQITEDLKKSLAETAEKLKEMTAQSEAGRTERDDARSERDDFRRQVQALQSNSSEMSKKVEEVSGTLRDREKDLAAAQREIDSLKAAAAAAADAQKAAAQKTAENSTKLGEALKSGLAQDLSSGNVKLVEGDSPRIVILGDALFEARSVILSESGQALVSRVAAALAGQEWERLRIEGHTDSQPVGSLPFVDNWDLGAARASSVTRWLAQQNGIQAKSLTAESRAFFAPVASNDTADGRRQNRRVEIVVERKTE